MDCGQIVIFANLSYIVPLMVRTPPLFFPTSAGLICADRAFVALACRTSLAP